MESVELNVHQKSVSSPTNVDVLHTCSEGITSLSHPLYKLLADTLMLAGTSKDLRATSSKVAAKLDFPPDTDVRLVQVRDGGREAEIWDGEVPTIRMQMNLVVWAGELADSSRL